MFDLDYLTNSMNYQAVLVEKQVKKYASPKEANNSAGKEAYDDQGVNSEEIDLHDEHFVLPIWSAYSTTIKSSKDKIQKTSNCKTCEKPVSQVEQIVQEELENTPISNIGPSIALNDGEPSYLDDPSMPHLKDIYASLSEGIFTDSSYDDEGVEQKDERGVVVRNKACLVAQGHRQEEGINYNEVSAHVARIEAIRIFLAFASYMGFIVYQIDVKSAFLYGIIDEEVYVKQPFGFVDPKFPNKIYKVVKALYGLHQAPRACYATLSTFLEKSRYKRGDIDKTLFIKQDKKDIMLVKQKEDGIFISQDKYVAEILKMFDFLSVKTASTPIETQKPLVKDKEAGDVDVHLYWFMIGSLMYLTASRPDIMRLISWQCKKKTIVATSTIKKKYVVAAHCATMVKGRLLEVTTTKQRLILPNIEDLYVLVFTPHLKWLSITISNPHQELASSGANGSCMVRNVDSPSKFLNYPRFLQVFITNQMNDLSSHTTKYTSHALTQKIFANLRRIGKGFLGVETHLFATMLVQPQVAAEQEDEEDEVLTAPTPPSPTHEPKPPSHEPITSPPQAPSVTPPPSPPQAQPAPPSSPS
nr:hypothetical protein [Tanacetum cinerariifolium]